MPKITAHIIGLTLVIVLFLCVFFSVASVHSLNQDEGTYAVGALRFADDDLLLQKVNTDKPPMIYHLQGIAVVLFGKSDMSVKLPSALALVVIFILTFLIGARLFGPAEGLFSALFIAVSPFTCYCGIGAMTDPPTVAFLTGSLLSVMTGRMKLAGFLFGLSVCTRQMAVLYLPVLMAVTACYWEGRQGIRKAAIEDIKNLVKGGFWPALWLVVWSAFFQMEKFHWFVQEMQSGKVTLGAKKAPVIERFGFWFSELAGFSIFGIILAAAFVGGVVLIAGRYIKKQSYLKNRSDALVLTIFVGTLIYYPLIHTIMGAPLYPRMMFPVLPITAVVLAYLVIAPAKTFLKDRKIIRVAAWVCFTAILIIGSRTNINTFIEPMPKDDVPELCEFLQSSAGPQGMIITSSMNREMLFYLHGNRIKRKQFKQSPKRVAALVKRNTERDIFLALRSNEARYLPDISSELSPENYLEHTWSTSRGYIDLYKIKVNAKITTEGDQSFVTYQQGGQGISTPINKETIEQALGRYLKNSLSSGSDISIRIEPGETGDLRLGKLRALEIEATGLKLKKAPVEKMEIRFENLKIDIVKLFALDRLIVMNSETKHGKIEMTQDGITSYIQNKNKDIDNMRVEIRKESVKISGALKAFGKTIEFSTSGPLTINERGQVSMLISSLIVNSTNLPGFIRSAIQSIVKPVLTVEVPALGLTGKKFVANDGRLTIEMN